MTRRNWATAFHALGLLLILGIGVAHYTKDILLPWYVAALGVPWEQLSAPVKAIFVSYMKLAGAGQISLALALGIVLFGPFRRGEAWANRTVAGIGCLATVLSAYAIYVVQLRTGAPEPWYNPLAGFVLFVIGFVLAPRR